MKFNKNYEICILFQNQLHVTDILNTSTSNRSDKITSRKTKSMSEAKITWVAKKHPVESKFNSMAKITSVVNLISDS